MNFVELFLEHTQYYESPGSFWKWAAYTAIGAVLRDNCFRTLGDHRVYPNLYTLLLADSAVHRKGHPIKLCEELVKRAKSTKVISGRSSIQGILDELSRGETDKVTGKIISGGSALFSASELSAGIVNDPEAVKILTDIYDFKEEYTSRLRGSGVFRIKNICFSLIAASNEELLIDKCHIMESVALCIELLPNYQGFVMAGGKSTISEVAALLIESIWASRGKYITKSEFLGRFVHIFDADLLDKCISTLVQAELIKMKLDGMIEGYVVTDK